MAAQTSPAPTQTTARAEQEATQPDILDMGKTTLIGIFMDPETPRALIRHARGKTTLLGIGDKVGRAQVTAIDSGIVTIRRGKNDTALRLTDLI